MSGKPSLQTDAYLIRCQKIPSPLIMSDDARNKNAEETKFYVIINLEQEAIQFEEVISLINSVPQYRVSVSVA